MGNLEKKPNLLPIKIITAILYLAITVFFVIALIGCLDEKYVNLSLAIFLILLLVYGSIAYLIEIILAIVGLVKGVAKWKKGGSIFDFLFFLAFIILPIVTELALIIVAKIIAN